MNYLFSKFAPLFLILVIFSFLTYYASRSQSDKEGKINNHQNLETTEQNKSDENYLTYTVIEGISLWDIASRFRVSVKEIRELNSLDGNIIKPGQVLKIPNTINIIPLGYEDKVYAQGIVQEDEAVQLEVEVEEPDSGEEIIEEENVEVKEPDDVKETAEEKIDEAIDKKEDEEDKESPLGTSRPTLEIITPKKDEIKTQRLQDDIVNLPSEMELKDLIQTMSEITGEAFILDDTVQGKKVTIIAPEGGFKKQNALRLFETILDLNGFAVVNKDGVNKILQKKDIKTESIPTEVGVSIGPSSDRFITKIINLKNVKADQVSNTLRPLVSKDGDVVVYPTSNTLIIIDTVDNVNRVLEILKSLDVEKKIEFVKIRNAEASDVAAKLLEIFGTSGGAPAVRAAPRTTRRGRAGREQTSQQAPVIGQSDILGFKVITDARTNSLIVIAYPKDMEKIKKVIRILDIKTEQVEQGIYVIRVRYADAEQLVGVLSIILGDTTIRTGAVRGGGVSRGGVGRGLDAARAGLGAPRTGLRGGEQFGTISRGIGSGGISGVVAETEGLRITADPSTNSLILIGSRRDYETLKEVIDQLDIRRRQVFVEAAILEVGLDDITSFGTNFSFGFTVNDDTLGFGGQNLPGVPSLLGVAADSDTAINLVGSLSGLFLGVVGEEVDVDGSGPIPPIPSFTALFQALTSVTDVNVLSTPSILTTDNEQAEIVVADVIPFPTGSTVGTAGVTVQTIERLPVGIRLAITPQISEGDYLNLNIITEVSNTTQAPAGLNTEQFGIATQTRSADSSVIVRDGQTIVIGGLVSDRESVIQNKTPLLGDIPLIGNIFKFKQTQSRKLNLMILLTPRIVESEEDMQKILEEQQRRKMLLQERGVDILEDKVY